MLNKKFTAIILSYKRPKNLQQICSTILSIGLVDKLIVSNNNPEIDLTAYLHFTDPRFELIAQSSHSNCFIRFQIALNTESDFFICIDDDVFLEKEQIEYLIKQLLLDPNRIHGFWGQTYEDINGELIFQSRINKNQIVNIINRAYFFTKEHVLRLFELIEACNLDYLDLGPFDDILLSFSSLNKPASHYIGHFKDCSSSNTPGIAVWKSHNFEARRIKILKTIIKIRNTDS